MKWRPCQPWWPSSVPVWMCPSVEPRLVSRSTLATTPSTSWRRSLVALPLNWRRRASLVCIDQMILTLYYAVSLLHKIVFTYSVLCIHPYIQSSLFIDSLWLDHKQMNSPPWWGNWGISCHILDRKLQTLLCTMSISCCVISVRFVKNSEYYIQRFMMF